MSRRDLTEQEVGRILKVLDDHEWRTRIDSAAAGNTYCPSCGDRVDHWKDQDEHLKNCEWAAVRRMIEETL